MVVPMVGKVIQDSVQLDARGHPEPPVTCQLTSLCHSFKLHSPAGCPGLPDVLKFRTLQTGLHIFARSPHR